MFRSVKFICTLSQTQMEELNTLSNECTRFSHRRIHGYSITAADRTAFTANKEKLVALNDAYGITPVAIRVVMKNVNDAYLYDIVEAPPFLHQECMLPQLIGFIISTIDDRHNAASAFNAERPWEFWSIKMPSNKGVVRKL